MNTAEFRVERSGLAGKEWTTICRHSSREYAQDVLDRQVRLASVGLFRLLAPDGTILIEKTARPLFSDN
jgi:hypothetical protein